MNALVIPVEGPVFELELVDQDGHGSLAQLQELVGGLIEALPVPASIAAGATAYINEEGKFTPGCEPNMRATDFMVPGVGLFFGDWIAGPMILCGFDPANGKHTDLPQAVIERARLIESEAA